jgi:alpha-L-fucosidase
MDDFMFVTIVLLVSGLTINLSSATLNNYESTKYTPDWDSLDSRPLPDWYDDAKIGIFMHFGPYAVPGMYNSWNNEIHFKTWNYICMRKLYYPLVH